MIPKVRTKPFSLTIVVKALRSSEVLLMTGFSMVGTLFSGVMPWVAPLDHLTCFAITLIFVYTIYALNSFADHSEDRASERLRFTTLISAKRYLLLFALLGTTFSISGWFLSKWSLVAGIVAILLWMMYYLPPLRLKSKLWWGTVIHFVAGVFHFHVGYCYFAEIGTGSIVISSYFGLLLATGHVNHEIIDHQHDSSSGIATSAVRIGTARTQRIRTMLSILGLAVVSCLWFSDWLTNSEFVPFAVASTIMAVASMVVKDEKPDLFQKVTRWSFLTAGIVSLILQTDYLRAIISL